MFLIGGCSFNSGRIRLLNYDVATSLFGNVPDEITVAKGDTLYSISRRYDVPLRDLITVNSLTPPYTLAVGQVLKIPSARYHIVSKGIEKRVKDLYPRMRILSLDFDSGVSDVNIVNRLLLFIDGLK